jgi:hypothetical protein
VIVFPRLLRIIGACLSAIEPLSQSDRANSQTPAFQTASTRARVNLFCSPNNALTPGQAAILQVPDGCARDGSVGVLRTRRERCQRLHRVGQLLERVELGVGRGSPVLRTIVPGYRKCFALIKKRPFTLIGKGSCPSQSDTARPLESTNDAVCSAPRASS